MKVTEVKSLSPYLKFSIPIGVGTTAICFLMKNQNVIKVFIETSGKHHLFYYNDMQPHLEYISSISNDTYIGPDEVLIMNNQVKAYIYPYVKGLTLKRLINDATFETIMRPYNKILDDTKKISEDGFQLNDLSQRNIILNEYYKVIDLDRGFHSDRKDLFESNRSKVNRIILNSIFDLGYNDSIDFLDDELNDLKYNANYFNPYCFYELLERLFYKNQTKKEVKKNIPIKVLTKNPYYYRVI